MSFVDAQKVYQILSREIGGDFGELGLRRRPKLQPYTPAQYVQFLEGVAQILKGQNLPVTVENAERAFAFLQANALVDKAEGKPDFGISQPEERKELGATGHHY
jgi:hypothetical protein